MLPKAVTDYLAEHRDERVEQLLELLRFPSVSSQGGREGDCLACVERIAEHLRGLGFKTELRPWRRHPILLARRRGPASPSRTVLLYGHYDVQPPEPLEQWETPPFEPAIRDGCIYARGASDDKGQLFAHIKAVEALVRTQGAPPLDVVFFVEGEEEIGSPELEQFVTAASEELRSDYAIVSDSDFFGPGLPTITYGLRGLAYLELTLAGPREDLHSGVHGGAVVNPLNALARMVAGMHDPAGRVTLPGFYDDVVDLTEAEREAWAALPFDEAEYAAALGTRPVGGERGRPLLERRWARPTLDCNGIVGGYQGEGAKTVIPAAATAKISMRLVPNQRPEKIVESFRAFVAAHTPAGIRASVAVSAEARPVLVPSEGPAMTAAKEALKEAFAADVALVRNGASVPITELIQRVLKVVPILMGFGLPDDNLHAPNERFRLEQFHGGVVASAAMLHNLAELK
jgi:acetylornithine deacetylase/succinyl-diaminopimelate desuccinylase-like protein